MIRLLFAVLVILFTASCTERIDIRVGDAPSRVIIYGYITSDAMQHSVRITRSAGFFSTESPQGISNAIVTISDNNGRIIPLHECAFEAGLYLTAPDVYGEEGKTYTLNVLLENGDEYRATAFMHHVVGEIDSIGLEISPIFPTMVQVLVYASNVGGDNNFSFFVAINDSIINSTIDNFFVVPNDFFNTENMEGVGMPVFILRQNPEHETRNEVLRIGDKVALRIDAISPEYTTFIQNVQSEIGGSNPIFGGPPANVPTNIVSSSGATPALGFFTAFASRHAYTIVTEDFSVGN